MPQAPDPRFGTQPQFVYPYATGTTYVAPPLDQRQGGGANSDPNSGSSEEPSRWRAALQLVTFIGVGYITLQMFHACRSFYAAPDVIALGFALLRGDWAFLAARRDSGVDALFHDSVVMMCGINPLYGAYGVILNKPMLGPAPSATTSDGEANRDDGGKEPAYSKGGKERSSDEAPPACQQQPLRACELPVGQSWLISQDLANNLVFIGGPVGVESCEAVIVHGVPEVPGALPIARGAYVGGDHRALRRKLHEGACTADEMLVVVGFSAWMPGQLRAEFARGGWTASIVENSHVGVVTAAGQSPHHHERYGAAPHPHHHHRPPPNDPVLVAGGVAGESTVTASDLNPRTPTAAPGSEGAGSESAKFRQLLKSINQAANAAHRHALASSENAGSSSDTKTDGGCGGRAPVHIKTPHVAMALAHCRAAGVQRALREDDRIKADLERATPGEREVMVMFLEALQGGIAGSSGDDAPRLFGPPQEEAAAAIWDSWQTCVSGKDTSQCAVAGQRAPMFADYSPPLLDAAASGATTLRDLLAAWRSSPRDV